MNIISAISASAETAKKGVFSEYAESNFGLPVPKVCNGVQAPQRAGKCANVWMEVVRLLATSNAMPSVQAILAALPAENVNNVKIEYYRAVKFIQGLPTYWAENGHTTEAQAEAPEAQAEAPKRRRQA